MTNTFMDLQSGWYNGLTKGLGQSTQSFQILQPAPPLASGATADQLLWSYFNNVPPATLDQQYQSAGGAQFFTNYSALLGALEGATQPPPSLETAIGAAMFAKWQKHLQSVSPTPALSKLPGLFLSWAMVEDPDKASAGAHVLSQMILDPVLAAQLSLEAHGTKPPDWSEGYADLTRQLAQAPSRAFSFKSATMNTDTSSAWSDSGASAFFGVWGDGSESSAISTTFAASEVTVEASFKHLMTFSATPGNWYNSAATSLADANQSGNPWVSASSINWSNTFGSPDGDLQRFATSLLVASGMEVTVTSTAAYAAAEASAIASHESSGLWPFYSGGSSSDRTTNTSSYENGVLTIKMHSAPGVPLVLGVNVLSAGRFLGHSAEAAEAQRSLVAA